MIDAAAVTNVDFKNLVHVFICFAFVPYTFRIDDHAGTTFAPIQTSGGIDPDAFQSHFLCLHVIAKRDRTLGRATTAPMAFFAYVDAKEYVLAIKQILFIGILVHDLFHSIFSCGYPFAVAPAQNKP